MLDTEVRFLCEGSHANCAWSLTEVTLPADSGPPPTRTWEEACFVTTGEVGFVVRGERFRATAGDFVYTPSGVTHGFSGVSAEPARALIFDAPAHAGVFVKCVDREAKNLSRELPKVLRIGADTGIRF